MKKKLIVLVAGGTGGHINAALALGEKYEQSGCDVTYYSGERPLDFQLFKEKRERCKHLPCGPFQGKNPFKLFVALMKNFWGFFIVLASFMRRRPQFVLGAGGYVCGPTLMAGFILGVPIFIIEQNSVLGLTNRILLNFCRKIFVNFKGTIGIPKMFEDKMFLSGNPVRSCISQLKSKGSEISNSTDKKILKIVVFGGSLGAGPINKLIWEFIGQDCKFPISIRHQTGKGVNIALLPRSVPSIHYEAQNYLHHIETDYDWADLIICRSGASTISELRLVQKSVILIPYPYHKDQHQFYNAQNLQEEAQDFYPVYIHSCESLQDNNFKELRKILLATQERKLYQQEIINKKSGPVIPDATTLIFEELKNYVW